MYGQALDLITLDEHVSHRLRQHSAHSGLTYERNLQRYYLKDQLRLCLSREYTLGDILLNQQVYPQTYGVDALHLSNQMHFINTRTRLPIELKLTQQFSHSGEDFRTANNHSYRQGSRG